MSALDEILLRKRKNRAPIGHRVEYYLCLDCWEQIDELALPYVEAGSEPLVEGDDAGVPYECHKCGNELKPRGAG